MTVKWFDGKGDIADIIALRKEVFCDEQHYPPELEIDEHDYTDALHLGLYDGGKLVACGRYVVMPSFAKLGRIAVKKEYRGSGVGSVIMENLFERAKTDGIDCIKISAQTHAIGFYKRHGFVESGIEYFDENIPHVDMYKNTVFDGCDWLEFGDDTEAAVYEKKFTAENIKSAELSVCGLGFFELCFGGKKFGEDMFVPAQSYYEPYDLTKVAYPLNDTLSCRIYYLKYDVTDALKCGENTMNIHVGAGWYGEYEDHSEGFNKKFGNIKLVWKLKITQKDGTEIILGSRDGDDFYKSFVVKPTIYNGERHDYRITKSPGNLLKAHSVLPPRSRLVLQDFPGDRITRRLCAKVIKQKKNSVIADIGENTSGYLVVKFKNTAKDGDKITVRYSEEIFDDRELNPRSSLKISEDCFIFGEGADELYPRFTHHAARYCEVTGDAEIIEFREIHSALECTSDFESSDETLNWLFYAYKRTQLANVHGFIPSDCPHRERLGYTGDGQLTARACMTVFDGRTLYKKWLEDIADGQDRYTGHIQHTAPFRGGGGGPGGWGGAVCIVPFEYYRAYGDKSVLEKYYENMRAYIRYMESRCEDGLVMREEKDGWCLGDWCAPQNQNLLPEPFVNTYFLIKCLDIVIKSSKLLGKENTDEYEKLTALHKTALTKKYFDENTASFAGGACGADAYAVDIGIGNGQTLQNVFTKYEALGHYDTGIFATDILTRVLFENGRADLAVKLLTSRDKVSFYYMKSQGATTLWENWSGADSHSHPMFGAAVSYLFEYILGIRKDESGKYTVNPAKVPGLSAHGYITVNGKKIYSET